MKTRPGRLKTKRLRKKYLKPWLDALRGDAYKQGRACLRDKDNNFCCLGVLCDLVKKELTATWLANNAKSNFGFSVPDGLEGGVTGLPPEIVYQLTGLDDDWAGDLASNNDRGDSFIEIANQIENEWDDKPSV